MSRVGLYGGLAVVAGLVVVTAVAIHGLLAPLLALVALVFLIGAGNLLYGKNSHGAMAQARTRPAQQERNRAIDEARRAARETEEPPRP
jgi:predicted membrane metal-binding protein